LLRRPFMQLSNSDPESAGVHYEVLVPVIQEAVALARESRATMAIQEKSDGSIVTTVDKAVEELIRDRLSKAVPGATFWGEELGYEPPSEAGYWLIDPIDGTTNFAHGSPLWGISVGFYKNGKIQMGVVALPDLNETFIGERGRGVWLNNQQLSPVEPGEIGPLNPVGYCEAVSKLGLKIPGKKRCLGAFVVDGTFALTGRFRAFIGVRQNLYDIAPVLMFAEELGMDVRYLDGRPLDLEVLLEKRPVEKPWAILPRGCTFTA
jgi:myo-inositol-1(or 4)-monophosphatase